MLSSFLEDGSCGGFCVCLAVCPLFWLSFIAVGYSPTFDGVPADDRVNLLVLT